MGAVQLACSSLTFNRDPLAKACAGVRELGFDAVEIGVFDQPGLGHLRPAEAAERLLEVEERLRTTAAAAGVRIAALTADADDPDPAVARQRMASICLMAHRLGARVLSVVVGPASLEE